MSRVEHIPYGYRIENGKAVVDETAAGQVRQLFENYLSGDSLKKRPKTQVSQEITALSN